MKGIVKLLLDHFRAGKIARMLNPLREYDEEGFVRDLAAAVTAEADRRRLNDRDRHYLLYRIQRSLMPRFVIADHPRVILDDDEFREFFRTFSDDNWTSYERKWNLKELLRLTSTVDGHFAECGVFRGGSAYLMCKEAERRGCEVHLFDSFEGLSAPASDESRYWSKGDLCVSEEQVRSNLSGFDCFKTFKGWIPTAFPEVADYRYSFLHVDVDLEQPTRDSIEFFYPRMDAGAVILLDDHGSGLCPGARATALEFFGDHGETVLDLATGQGLVIKRRTLDR